MFNKVVDPMLAVMQQGNLPGHYAAQQQAAQYNGALNAKQAETLMQVIESIESQIARMEKVSGGLERVAAALAGAVPTPQPGVNGSAEADPTSVLTILQRKRDYIGRVMSDCEYSLHRICLVLGMET